MIKLCLSLVAFLLGLLLNTSDVYALSLDSTYGNLSSTSNSAIDLVNYAISFESFIDSDYVIFQAEQYSYYIVWGDLTYSNNKFTGSNIEYINYYRTSTSTGYNYTYDYNYGTDSTFSLNTDFSVVTNIPNAGLSNETYRIFKFNDNLFKLLKGFLILLTSFIFVLMVKNLRRANE